MNIGTAFALSLEGMKIKLTICLKLAIIASFMIQCTRSANELLQIGREALIKSSSIKYIEHIVSAAALHRLDPALVAAVIAAESNFNPNARSFAGAKGLMQINSVTARYLKLKNVYDPYANIHAGAKYLSELSEKFGGNTKLALAAYNAGPSAVKKYGGVPPYRETRKYIKKVMDLFEVYKVLI